MSLSIVAVLALVAFWWFTRSRMLFRLSVRDGKVLVVNGRVPPRFLGDVRDVVERDRVQKGTITAVAREDGGGLEFSRHVPEGTQQRLRNAFRLYPISALRQAPAIAKPTLGQVLGIAWLAWLLDTTTRNRLG